MSAARHGRWLLGTFAALLVVLLSAEQLDLLRSDSLAAAMCMRELLADKADAMTVVTQHKDAIMSGAERYDLPPEFLAAIVYGHQRTLTPRRKFTDCAGSALGADLSLGLAQVRISTAAATDALKLADLSPATFKNYRAMLFNPSQNIGYQARELRGLLERDNRFPGMTAEELIHDPFAMSLIMSEYRAGPLDTPSGSTRRSGNAFFDLEGLLREELYIFERAPADVAQIRTASEEYLGYIYCDSDIYNASVCVSWQGRTNPAE